MNNFAYFSHSVKEYRRRVLIATKNQKFSYEEFSLNKFQLDFNKIVHIYILCVFCNI